MNSVNATQASWTALFVIFAAGSAECAPNPEELIQRTNEHIHSLEDALQVTQKYHKGTWRLVDFKPEACDELLASELRGRAKSDHTESHGAGLELIGYDHVSSDFGICVFSGQSSAVRQDVIRTLKNEGYFTSKKILTEYNIAIEGTLIVLTFHTKSAIRMIRTDD